MARDDKGRFVSGQSGNPNGRPTKKREERFLEITLESCTFADWKEIVKKAVDKAKRGDATARKWLSDYLIGPAQQHLDLTTNDESLNSGTLDDHRREALLAAILERGEPSATGQGSNE